MQGKEKENYGRYYFSWRIQESFSEEVILEQISKQSGQ